MKNNYVNCIYASASKTPLGKMHSLAVTLLYPLAVQIVLSARICLVTAS